MKVTGQTQHTPPPFKPFQLSLTFETQEEFEMFYTLMNAIPVCIILRESGIEPDNIRAAMREHHDFTSNASEFCDRLRNKLRHD
jgi:hypothetical protein